MNLGRAIRHIRKKRRLTQEELAKKCQMTLNGISYIERGKTFPPLGTIDRIAHALDVSVGHILFKAIEEDDLPEKNRERFYKLHKGIEELLFDEYI